MGWLIGNIILGAIVGFGARAVLPGAQDIGVLPTVGIGAVAAIIGFAIFSWFWLPITFVITVLLAAGAIHLGIKQGILKPNQNSSIGSSL